MSKFITRAVASLFGALGFCLLTANPAHAAGVSGCSVSNVGLDSRLSVNCTGTTYYAFTTAQGSCPAQSVDRIKMWHSAATAALLSGKTLELWIDTSIAGCSRITWVQINR